MMYCLSLFLFSLFLDLCDFQVDVLFVLVSPRYGYVVWG